MTLTQIVFLAAVFLLVMGGVVGVVTLLRPSAAQQRLRGLTEPAPGSGAPETRQPLLEWIAQRTRGVSRYAAPEDGEEMTAVRRRMQNAGIRNPQAPAAFFGSKVMLTLMLPVLGFALLTATNSLPKGNNALLVLLLLAAFGYYLPNLILSRLVFLRQREIFEAFPDALDLMTVCVEAGLGTESALQRVGEDMQLKSPALSDEIRLVNLELRAGMDRERALRNLANRTGVDEVASFVTMMSQAERFGTSIAASLRVHSEMLRTKRRQKAEEAAAKIALKLLFPLIFFIFPSLLVVLMGPAAIQIRNVLLPTMAGQG